jgi:hypothetical protein
MRGRRERREGRGGADEPHVHIIEIIVRHGSRRRVLRSLGFRRCGWGGNRDRKEDGKWGTGGLESGQKKTWENDQDIKVA